MTYAHETDVYTRQVAAKTPSATRVASPFSSMPPTKHPVKHGQVIEMDCGYAMMKMPTKTITKILKLDTRQLQSLMQNEENEGDSSRRQEGNLKLNLPTGVRGMCMCDTAFLAPNTNIIKSKLFEYLS